MSIETILQEAYVHNLTCLLVLDGDFNDPAIFSKETHPHGPTLDSMWSEKGGFDAWLAITKTRSARQILHTLHRLKDSSENGEYSRLYNEHRTEYPDLDETVDAVWEAFSQEQMVSTFAKTQHEVCTAFVPVLMLDATYSASDSSAIAIRVHRQLKGSGLFIQAYMIDSCATPAPPFNTQNAFLYVHIGERTRLVGQVCTEHSDGSACTIADNVRLQLEDYPSATTTTTGCLIMNACADYYHPRLLKRDTETGRILLPQTRWVHEFALNLPKWQLYFC